MKILVTYQGKEIMVPRFMIQDVKERIASHIERYGDLDDYLLDYSYDAILGLDYDGVFSNSSVPEWFKENDIPYDRNLAIVLANAAIHHVHGFRIIEK